MPRFAVPGKGVGLADYSRDIGRAIQRPGITLTYTQSLRLNALVFSNSPSAYAWVVTPLAPGASQHIIDQSTGLALPFTVAAGYTYSLIQRTVTGSEDIRLDSYLDKYMGVPLLVMSAQVAGGVLFFKQQILGLSTKMVDSTASSSHIVDDVVTNLGAGNYEGGLADVIVYEAVGTPPLPKTKIIKCKWCGYQVEVPIETDRLECPECHQLTIYYVPAGFRRSA